MNKGMKYKISFILFHSPPASSFLVSYPFYLSSVFSSIFHPWTFFPLFHLFSTPFLLATLHNLFTNLSIVPYLILSLVNKLGVSVKFNSILVMKYKFFQCHESICLCLYIISRMAFFLACMQKKIDS